MSSWRRALARLASLRVAFPLVVLCLAFVLAPAAAAQQQTHVVQPGETLFRIALQYGLTTQELAAANGIVNMDYVFAGQVLVIPGSASASNSAATAVASTTTATHVVQRGEILSSIALKYGVSMQAIAQANGISNPSLIYYGQTLIIPGASGSAVASPEAAPAPAAPATTGATGTTHVVQRGEILSGIALQYGVSTQAIAQANGIYNPSLIYYGQTLIIPGVSSSATASPEAAPAPAAVQSLGEKWIDVNLSTQTLTAYEGTTPVFTSLISSGTWDHPTVTGQFSIYLRYESQTMNGYRLGYDYYLPNVPYVMYFYRDYSLHGTYWHSNFGTPMSHGCVNMYTPDAQWLYYWSSYGTPVNVHY
jgi:LysM repeat protein